MYKNNSLLRINNLTKYYPIEKGLLKKNIGTIKAVDEVSFDIIEGETLGLVGESGCGKTTIGRCLLRAIEPTSGEIEFNLNNKKIDILALNSKNMRKIRRNMQMIFQDPYGSLDPRMTILDIVGEPLKVNKIITGKKLEQRVRSLLEKVGLEVQHLNRYPHAFSGGQRQRIGIARALSTNPRLIVCDEAVSALDVSVQAQIINLLLDLQSELKLTYLFIAHDLSVIQHVSDRVAVMYVGKIVELSDSNELFQKPKHPYTEALLSAVPNPDPEQKKTRIRLSGEVANPANIPSGCTFHPRCIYSKKKCIKDVPTLKEISPNQFVACHYSDELQLQGV